MMFLVELLVNERFLLLTSDVQNEIVGSKKKRKKNVQGF